MVFLKPNDILLYRPAGIFGRLISIKTWHAISHVEIYDRVDPDGSRWSVASRDGLGVDRYPLRLSELTYILRPTVPLNRVAGQQYFDSLKGTPYGWVDLLDFIGLNVNTRGIVCSPFAAGYLRAEGWPVFPADPINKVAPFQFLDLVGSECQLAYDFHSGILPPV